MQTIKNYRYEDVFTASADYASRFAGPVGQWLLSVQEKILLDFIKDRSSAGGFIFDLGGGHGQLLNVAQQTDKKLLIGASHLDAFSFLTKRISGDNKSAYSGTVSDILSLPFRDKSFEFVSCVRLLSHCENWQQLIYEMARVSDKYIVVDYPPLFSSNILNSVFFPLKKKLEGNTRQFKIFNHAEVDQVFKTAGFKLIERRGQFFWPMVLHRKIANVWFCQFIEQLADLFGLRKFFGNPSLAIYCRETQNN